MSSSCSPIVVANDHPLPLPPSYAPCPRPSKPSASPELRRHLRLPHKTRRFGRRPYPIAGGALGKGDALESASYSGSLPNPAEERDADDIADGGRSGQTGGSFSGELYPTSPPKVLSRRLHAGREDEREGNRSANHSGVAAGWCAEWAVSFTGWLEQGVTTVKVRGGGKLRRRIIVKKRLGLARQSRPLSYLRCVIDFLYSDILCLLLASAGLYPVNILFTEMYLPILRNMLLSLCRHSLCTYLVTTSVNVVPRVRTRACMRSCLTSSP